MTETKPKKRPGPAPTGKGTLVGVRLQAEDLAALDKWREAQGEPVTRPEAVRRLLAKALGGG